MSRTFNRPIRQLHKSLVLLKRAKQCLNPNLDERTITLIDKAIDDAKYRRNDLFFADHECYPWEQTRMFSKILRGGEQQT